MDDTRSVTEDASRAYRIAVKHELRRLEAELERLGEGGATLDPEGYRLLGGVPAIVAGVLARLGRSERELDLFQRSEPRLRESVKALQSLSMLSRQINSTLELDEILKLLVELGSAIVDTEGSMIYLFDDAAQRFEMMAAHRLDEETIEAIEATIAPTFLADPSQQAGVVVLPEIAMAVRHGGSERSLIVVPLRHRERPVGLAVMLSLQHRLSFFQPDLELLELLANSVSVALSNARLFEETRRLSITDDLTQLRNSRFLADYLRRGIEAASESDQRLSLLFMDLDGFKQINDSYGHNMGSAVLVEVAEVLRACVGDGAMIARFGGDEFVVVVPGAEAFKAFLLGERIRASIARFAFLRSHGRTARLTISIGVATFPDHARTAQELIARADSAMYQVKNATKDGVSLSVESRSA